MEGEKVSPFLPKMTAHRCRRRPRRQHRRRGGTRACDGRGDKYANRITGISLAKTLVFKKQLSLPRSVLPNSLMRSFDFRLSTALAMVSFDLITSDI